MKIKLFFILYLCLSAGIAMGQGQKLLKDAPLALKDRIVFGGGLALQFGNATLIDISPIIGYKLTDRLIIGTGLTYKYNYIKDYYYAPATNYQSNTFGGSIWGRYYVLENFFAHTEVEQLHTSYSLTPNGGSEAIDITSVLIGGGYRQRISQRVSFNIMVLYNLNDSPFSPYSNPIIRAGINVGM